MLYNYTAYGQEDHRHWEASVQNNSRVALIYKRAEPSAKPGHLETAWAQSASVGFGLGLVSKFPKPSAESDHLETAWAQSISVGLGQPGRSRPKFEHP